MENNEKWEIIPDGEPNIYFVKNKKTWLCQIKLNGELSYQEQIDIINLMLYSMEIKKEIKNRLKQNLDDITGNN